MGGTNEILASKHDIAALLLLHKKPKHASRDKRGCKPEKKK